MDMYVLCVWFRYYSEQVMCLAKVQLTPTPFDNASTTMFSEHNYVAKFLFKYTLPVIFHNSLAMFFQCHG